ncbi:hypothetical protein DAEQUDRAFT_707469 [Daedalea quercina L-15889]|uniref:Uncharacterized protein n=1 Tax=Daedalea quercina L-15889 TaxID=1314783 RepID=A0A165RTJ5_9APHY|nr:hypothetical protein DAEQUDRAFT_707469 [Daedalea quercina L-15889]
MSQKYAFQQLKILVLRALSARNLPIGRCRGEAGPVSAAARVASRHQIFVEEIWLQGALLSKIANGVELALFVMCFHILVRQMNRHNKKSSTYLLSFITIVFILGTLFTGGNTKFTQKAFVGYRDFPGGPRAFQEADFSDPVDEIANVSWVVSNWLMDMFLVWRFVIIYRSVTRQWIWLLLALPCLMLLASIGLGIADLVGITNSSPFAILNVSLSYYVMSLSLNVIVTILIAGRLLVFRYQTRRLIGAYHTSTYTNVIAILVEIAALYSLFVILFIVQFGLGSPFANIFLQVVSQIQTISSLLIIFRVARGRAWSEHTATKPLTQSSTRSTCLPPISDIAFRSNQTATVPESIRSKELYIYASAI